MAASLLPYRPYSCVWELTLGCNLRCSHCGSDAGEKRHRELTTEECLTTVDQLADLECQLLTLSGGEPTLRKDWPTISRAATRRGITVNLVTNGTTMTEDTAAQAADAGLANVGISIDGPEPVHDALRGAGVFRRAARAAEQLRAQGVPVGALTHLNQNTVRSLAQTHRVVADLGFELWRLQLGKPMGRLTGGSELLLEPPDLLQVIPEIARLRQLSPLVVTVGDSLGYYGPYERMIRRHPAYGEERSWAGCQAGLYAVGIESDGGVKGCLSLQGRLAGHGEREAFREGSLRERSLAEIWFDADAFAFNRRWQLEDLRGACRTCDHALLCRGGAKCVAAAFTGRLDDNPYCYHRQARAAERARSRPASLRRRALASALSMGLGLLGIAGCDSRSVAPVGEGSARDFTSAGDRGPLRSDGSRETGFPDRGLSLDADPCRGYLCHNVCPSCDYGIEPPPELFQTCCCRNVCCDCDYGLPPPGCCK
jgi:MoaA/NifB/PqqE/SkfB family radical SAM enzyme